MKKKVQAMERLMGYKTKSSTSSQLCGSSSIQGTVDEFVNRYKSDVSRALK